jgi:multiple sugar transport system ATP-binding protein
MDEPLSNLDAKLRATMRTEIKKLVSSLGITTVYVTHDQVEALSMADRIAVMRGGNMVQVASPAQIYDRPETEFVADFIGSPGMNLFAAQIVGGQFIDCEVQAFADHLGSDEFSQLTQKSDSKGRIFIGVRPEHLRIVSEDTPGSVSALVEFVEPLGQTTNVYLTIGSRRFTIVTDRPSVSAGDTVGIRPDNGKVRLVAYNN